MIGATTINATPQMVIMAITGATRKLARIEMMLNSPDSITITGKQKIVAEMGIASASARRWWSFRDCNQLVIAGARKSKPAVAKTERAKPASRT